MFGPTADSDRLEHQLEEAVTLRQDYESSASKLRTLEKQVKSLRQEKDDVHKVAEFPSGGGSRGMTSDLLLRSSSSPT